MHLSPYLYKELSQDIEHVLKDTKMSFKGTISNVYVWQHRHFSFQLISTFLRTFVQTKWSVYFWLQSILFTRELEVIYFWWSLAKSRSTQTLRSVPWKDPWICTRRGDVVVWQGQLQTFREFNFCIWKWNVTITRPFALHQARRQTAPLHHSEHHLTTD
jgi:hypothetical protein